MVCNGNSVPSRAATCATEKSLACWVKHQRAQHSTGDLPLSKVEALQSVPGWQWSAAPDWHEQYQKFRTWQGTIKQNSSNPEERQLARWVNNQRTAYWSGALDVECTQALEKLANLCWQVPGWHEQYKKFTTWQGTLKQNSSNPEERQLARWVNNQRTAYSKGTLDLDYEQALDKLPNWCWGVRHAGWEDKYDEAVSWFFDEPYSHDSPCPFYPSTSDMADADPDLRTPEQARAEKSLALWMAKQRQSYAAGRLQSVRVEMLAELPGWTWNHSIRGAQQLHERGWDMMFKEVQALPKGRLPICSGRDTKANQAVAEWFWRNVRLFKSSLQPRRRLRIKQSPVRRMPAHRAVRFEAFLRSAGHWHAVIGA